MTNTSSLEVEVGLWVNLATSHFHAVLWSHGNFDGYSLTVVIARKVKAPILPKINIVHADVTRGFGWSVFVNLFIYIQTSAHAWIFRTKWSQISHFTLCEKFKSSWVSRTPCDPEDKTNINQFWAFKLTIKGNCAIKCWPSATVWYLMQWLNNIFF